MSCREGGYTTYTRPPRGDAPQGVYNQCLNLNIHACVSALQLCKLFKVLIILLAERSVPRVSVCNDKCARRRGLTSPTPPHSTYLNPPLRRHTVLGRHVCVCVSQRCAWVQFRRPRHIYWHTRTYRRAWPWKYTFANSTAGGARRCSTSHQLVSTHSRTHNHRLCSTQFGGKILVDPVISRSYRRMGRLCILICRNQPKLHIIIRLNS